MDYTMEDTQNSAPNAHEASKLGPSSQRNDTQGVTKRYAILVKIKALFANDLPV